MPNGSETPDYVLKGINEEYALKGINTAAHRLERIAAVMRAMPTSERTEGILEVMALLMVRVLETSPDDQADAVQALAKVMRRG
jgi:hypothetical protein